MDAEGLPQKPAPRHRTHSVLRSSLHDPHLKGWLLHYVYGLTACCPQRAPSNSEFE